MDAEKVYVTLSDIKDKLLCGDPEDIDVLTDLIILIDLAKSEMYSKELKKNKKLNQFNVMRRILKRTAQSPRECLRYSYIHTDGL